MDIDFNTIGTSIALIVSFIAVGFGVSEKLFGKNKEIQKSLETINEKVNTINTTVEVLKAATPGQFDNIKVQIVAIVKSMDTMNENNKKFLEDYDSFKKEHYKRVGTCKPIES